MKVERGLFAEGASRLALNPATANKVRAIAETQGLSISIVVDRAILALSHQMGLDIDQLMATARLTRFTTIDKKNPREHNKMLKDALAAVAMKNFKQFDASDLIAGRDIFKIVGKSYHNFVCKLEGYVVWNPRTVSTFSHLIRCGIKSVKPIESEEEWTHKRVLETIEKYK